MLKHILLTTTFALSVFYTTYSQDNRGKVRGDFQTDFQLYRSDSLIGAPEVPEKFRLNGYLNIMYDIGNFSAGVRYETYQNALLGYDPRYKGSGIASRWASYRHQDFEITAGNFYEQFGSGILLRSYEDRSLGLDNSLDGLKLSYKPVKGVYLKGVVGQHRYFFDKAPGIIRGVDGEIHVNDLREKWNEKHLRVVLGSSFVSKHQQDKDPLYVLPENVGAYAGRINILHKGKVLFAEYAHKINDPSAVNNIIYKNGEALFVNMSYSVKGFSTSISAKRIDNMNFRSDRNATGNVLQINYLPAITKPHVYVLSGFYPYATQPNGEMGIQGEIGYNIPENTFLGGKYGTNVSVGFAGVHDIEKVALNDSTSVGQSGTLGYNTNFFSYGDELFFKDVNFSFNRRLSKNLRMRGEYVNIKYNVDVIKGGEGGIVNAHIGIIDMSYKIKRGRTLRWEVQHMYIKKADWYNTDQGNWAMALLEYTMAPNWSFGVMDAFNYGNDDKNRRIHHYIFSLTYTKNANRISLSYGKQREGIMCVGGVCRIVPASNGISVSITSNF